MMRWLAFFFGLTAAPSHGMALLLAAGSDQSFEPELPALTYAASDATHFAAAVQSVGMSPGDASIVKTNPTRAELIAALAGVKNAFATDDQDPVQKFIFYFSGHSDERGLHLKDGLFSREELHESLEKIGARTKIVVLDSCFAGALALKGVRPVSDLESVKFSLDEPSGSIFLTASSARDMAVESRTLKGSLFTQHLIAGMYGKADGNRDGVVTATELYEYAFRETQLTSYMLPTGTPQKPELISDLRGRGAVSVSFPAGRTGKLRLLADLSGKIAIQSLTSATSFEMEKPQGRAIELPLPSGPYRMWVREGKMIGVLDLTLAANGQAGFSRGDVKWRAATQGETLKGGVLKDGGRTAARESLRFEGLFGTNRELAPYAALSVGRGDTGVRVAMTQQSVGREDGRSGTRPWTAAYLELSGYGAEIGLGVAVDRTRADPSVRAGWRFNPFVEHLLVGAHVEAHSQMLLVTGGLGFVL